jgi:hypothetical protein
MDSSASTGHDHAGACICSIASLLETQAHNGNSSPSHNCPGGCMAVKQGDIIRASVPLIPIGPTTPLSCPQFFTITYQHSQCILIMSLSVLGGRGWDPRFIFLIKWGPLQYGFSQNSSVNVYPPIMFLLLTWEINPAQSSSGPPQIKMKQTTWQYLV